jgi:hypothetical protein
MYGKRVDNEEVMLTEMTRNATLEEIQAMERKM